MIVDVGRKRARRERDPRWGFRIEVRAWEPPREQRVDSPAQQLSDSIGMLLARHAAVLVAGEPLVDAEIDQRRWLTSPLFAAGLAAISQPKGHPLAYLTAHLVPGASASPAASLAVDNPHAQDGISDAVREMIRELASETRFVGATAAVYTAVRALARASDADAASRKVDLGGIKYDRCRRLLIGWMLTQTGVIRQACALVALLKEELPLAAERASAYYPAPAADVTAEPSKAELGAAEATAQLAERCTEILTERGASMCAGSLQVVWSAAESLATQMQYEGIVGFMAGAELLLAATPQADPRFLSSSASAALSEAHVMQICTHLSEEAMQWLRSRSDAAAITSCLRVQQSRALSRAAGLRLGARILQMYAAQPHVVSHALELMQQARSGESNSRSTPLDARCSLPHLLACSLAALPDLSSPSALSSLLPALSLSVCAIPFLSRVTSKVAPRV